MTPAGGGYSLSSFDSNGRTVASTGELKERELRIVTPTDRFAGAFSEDGQTLGGTWERLEGGGREMAAFDGYHSEEDSAPCAHLMLVIPATRYEKD